MIMELCFKIEGHNQLFAIMIGFIGSICSFIYAITRNDLNVKV